MWFFFSLEERRRIIEQLKEGGVKDWRINGANSMYCGEASFTPDGVRWENTGKMHPIQGQLLPMDVPLTETERRRLHIGDWGNANTGELQDILDERAEDWYNSMPTQEEEDRIYGCNPDQEFAL